MLISDGVEAGYLSLDSVAEEKPRLVAASSIIGDELQLSCISKPKSGR
jgi:hypothetical protein